MKHRTSLTLLEPLLMIMVLALAAALCIRAFAYSGRLSKEDRIKAEAMAKAQNAAELVKYYKGDIKEAFEKMGWTYLDGFGAELNSDWDDCKVESYLNGVRLVDLKYHVLVSPGSADDPYLGTLLITVLDAKTDGVICSIEAAWQEDME